MILLMFLKLTGQGYVTGAELDPSIPTEWYVPLHPQKVNNVSVFLVSFVQWRESGSHTKQSKTNINVIKPR